LAQTIPIALRGGSLSVAPENDHLICLTSKSDQMR
jgi:hypothetical protein